MRGGQGVEQANADLGGASRRDRSLVADDVGERAALDQLHHEVGLLVLLADVEHAHCARMVQPGRRTRLAQRPLPQQVALLRVDARREPDLLHRDRAGQQLIAGGPDDAHAAAT